jgi:hypothetical protein
MSERILSTNGTVLSRDGFITQTGLEVAACYEGFNRYIRVGTCLYWRDDLKEDSDRFTCLSSGSVILL